VAPVANQGFVNVNTTVGAVGGAVGGGLGSVPEATAETVVPIEFVSATTTVITSPGRHGMVATLTVAATVWTGSVVPF